MTLISDERAIENLLYRYAELIDDGDLEGVAALFANGIIKTQFGEDGFRGYDQVLSMYQSATRLHESTGTPLTQHVISNCIIELSDEFSASARSRFSVVQATPELPLQVIITGRYHDLFSKTDGQWHFSERVMQPQLMGELSQHLMF
jgi:3-phenylpropionate/cinnamic acid dioxygenase small subunit